MKPFVSRLAARLVQAGVLTEHQHKVLGLFRSSRWPEADHGPEAEVRQRLRSVLVDDCQAQSNDAILAGLVAAVGLIDTVVDKGQRKQAKRRADELGKDNELGDAVRQAIRASQDAVTAATVAATTAATAATT